MITEIASEQYIAFRTAKCPVDNTLTHLPLDKYGQHFPDDIVKCIFINRKFCIVFQFLLKFVSEGPIDNKPASV